MMKVIKIKERVHSFHFKGGLGWVNLEEYSGINKSMFKFLCLSESAEI
jgi:hypothetical protein